MTRRQIRIEKPEHVGVINNADAFLPLHLGDVLVKPFHFCPMHLRPEMMFGVISVIEENPVINFAVTAHAPRNRGVWIAAVMTEVPVKVTEAVSEVEKRQKEKNDVTPVQQEHDE